MMNREIFRQELEDVLRSPSSASQLAAAVVAHAAYLHWQQEQTKENWRAFARKWSRV